MEHQDGKAQAHDKRKEEIGFGLFQDCCYVHAIAYMFRKSMPSVHWTGYATARKHPLSMSGFWNTIEGLRTSGTIFFFVRGGTKMVVTIIPTRNPPNTQRMLNIIITQEFCRLGGGFPDDLRSR